MADISKIEIESGTYNIKDEVARNLIANIGNKKILFIGDSYLAMDNGTNGIIDKFKYISGITNVISNVYSGTGFEYTVDNKNFLTLLNEVPNDNDITDIIVIGGYNDQYSNKANVYSNIGTFVSNAKTKFPNAQVYIGCAGFTQEENKRYPIFETYCVYAKCNNFGAIYLNGIESVMHDTYLFIGGLDQTHPNDNGKWELATAIYQAWKNGYYQKTYNYSEIPLTLSGNATSGDLHLYGMIMNNITHVVHPSIETLNFANHPSFSDIHTVNIEIATLNIGVQNAIISPWTYNMYPIPVTCAVEDATGYRKMNGNIQFLGNKLVLIFEEVENANWTDITDLVSIEINSFHADFPIQML